MLKQALKRPRVSIGGGQPVFDNDDSSNHSALALADFDENSLSLQNEASTNSSDQQHFPQNQYVPDRTRRPQANVTNNSLNACLDHLWNTLSKKDKEGFFQYPVTDQLAPGYSQIISNPMDFSTLRKKINRDEYSNISQFRSDFELICENAMKYNRPDTIYWQAAKRLSQSGGKLFAKERLISFRRNLDCFANLTEREFGFRLDLSSQVNDEQTLNGAESMEISSNVQETSNSIPNKKPTLRLPRYYEKLPNLLAEEEDDDESTAEEALIQAQQVGHHGREKFSLRHPNSKYLFSYQKPNGTTELNILNQTESLNNNQSQARVITIGELSSLPSSAGGPSAHALNSNSSSFVNEIEKKNRLLPRYFLDYGSFSSHAPQFDSSFCTLPKDELDLLIHTYGSEFVTQNTIDVVDYAKDCGEIELSELDRIFSSNKKRRETNHSTSLVNGHGRDEFHSNESSNASNSDQTGKEFLRQQIDAKLDENTKLLVQLRQAQYDRLTQPINKVHQTLLNGQQQQQQTTNNETLNENELAEKVLVNLNEMSQMELMTPERLITIEAIHNNLGIVLNDDNSNGSNSIDLL